MPCSGKQDRVSSDKKKQTSKSLQILNSREKMEEKREKLRPKMFAFHREEMRM